MIAGQCTEGTPSPEWYCGGQGGRRGHSPWTAARQRKKNRPCDSHHGDIEPFPADVSDEEATCHGDDVDMDNIASQMMNVRLDAFDAPASVATTATYSPPSTNPRGDGLSSACVAGVCPSDSTRPSGPFWLPASPFTPPDRGLRHSWAGPTSRADVKDKALSIARLASSPTACCAPPGTPLTGQHADDVAARPSRTKGRGPAYRFGLAASLPTVVQRLLRPSGSFRAAERPSSSKNSPNAAATAAEEACHSPSSVHRKARSSSSPAVSHRGASASPQLIEAAAASPADHSHHTAAAAITPGYCGNTAAAKPRSQQQPVAADVAGRGDQSTTTQEQYDDYMSRVDVEDDDQGFQLFSCLHQVAAPPAKAAAEEEEDDEDADEGDSTAVERDLFDDEFCEELDGCSQGQFDVCDDFSTPQRLSSSSLSPGGGAGGGGGRDEIKTRGATMDRGMGAALRGGGGGGGGMGFGNYHHHGGGYERERGQAVVPLDQLTVLEEFNQQLNLAASARDRGRADLVWATLCERGLAPDLRTLNLMVRCFSRCLADPDEAEHIAREVCLAGNLSPNATTYDLLAETRMHFDQLWVK